MPQRWRYRASLLGCCFTLWFISESLLCRVHFHLVSICSARKTPKNKRALHTSTGSDTKPRRLLVHLTSEQNAQDLMSSAKALLKKSHDHYIASTIYFNPDLTAAEAKLAFEQRQRRREAKIAKLTRDETCGVSATTPHGTASSATTTVLNPAETSTSATVPAPIDSNLSAEAASFTTVTVSDATLNTLGQQPCV